MANKILVTGGAGYVGSHTLRVLRVRGYDPICFDNLSTGFRSFAGDVPFVMGDLAIPADIESVFADNRIAAVIHFAAHALVEESYRNPFKYYHDNILNALHLLEAMRKYSVRHIILSSTCATYGIPSQIPISESTPLNPVNPYGVTKMVIERMLGDYERAHDMRSVALRYFNAAGAHHDSTIGEWHTPESHLIPRLFNVALEKDGVAEIYGNDYPTPDGTCVRDYIHVTDLGLAHAAALDYLLSGKQSEAFNLGTGQGCSVLEVVNQVSSTTGRRIAYEFKPRRPGDPPTLIADPSKAKEVLGWSAAQSSLPEIVQTAWNWHKRRRNSEGAA